MNLRPTITVEAELTINDREAVVLEHLCSYDLAEWFAQHCSDQFPAAIIKSTLYGLKMRAAKIVTARNKALAAITAVAEGRD